MTSSPRWEELATGDQDPVVGSRSSLEFLIHGVGNRDRRGAESELGSAMRGRMASPMAWRLYPGRDGGVIPVMTWSPRKLKSVSGHGLRKILGRQMGFERSLAGQSMWTDR